MQQSSQKGNSTLYAAHMAFYTNQIRAPASSPHQHHVLAWICALCGITTDSMNITWNPSQIKFSWEWRSEIYCSQLTDKRRLCLTIAWTKMMPLTTAYIIFSSFINSWIYNSFKWRFCLPLQLNTTKKPSARDKPFFMGCNIKLAKDLTYPQPHPCFNIIFTNQIRKNPQSLFSVSIQK